MNSSESALREKLPGLRVGVELHGSTAQSGFGLMDAAFLRVKRKRCAEPEHALLLDSKRVRAESGDERMHSSVFKFATTVATQDALVQDHVREALSCPRIAQALRPSHSSSDRIIRDLRNTKWSIRRDERYRILSSHRAGLLKEPLKKQEAKENTEDDMEPRLGDVQVFDIVQEDAEEDEREREESTESDPETILCNALKMMHEMLSVSTHAAGAEHREKENVYVYDLYYQETATPGWIQDILSVRPYTDEGELVTDLEVWEQEVYEDEDDENADNNWRNDYPDEEESEDENSERYEGLWSEELLEFLAVLSERDD